MRGWGKRASRDRTEVTCRFRLYGCREHGGQTKGWQGLVSTFAPPREAPGQHKRVRGQETHMMCVSWLPGAEGQACQGTWSRGERGFPPGERWGGGVELRN